jgi:nucleoid-associated protein YgaU
MVKLTFQRLTQSGGLDGDPFEVQYSPTELGFSKSAQFADIAIPGLEQPLTQFVRGDAETLSLELFFDSTENGTGEDAVPVTETVDKFQKLVAISGDLHAPPLVQITWGDNFPGTAMGASAETEKSLKAIVLSVARSFTLFNPDGKPLRAKVTLSLKRYATLQEQIDAINIQSADHTRLHIVQQGETLPLIAHRAYDDVNKWRVIAEHNNLADVRTLPPGLQLELPPLI